MRLAMLCILAVLFHIESGFAQALCSDNEVVVWSCKNPDASYAVCASDDLTQASGYLHYRVIQDAELVLELPETGTHPREVFRFAMHARGAALEFEDAGVHYWMSENLEGMVSLAVSEAGGRSDTIDCVDSDYTLTLTDTINRLKAAGIAE